MYILKAIEQKEVWNTFVIEQAPLYSFLSSWEWGEFNIAQWNDVIRRWIYGLDDALIWVLLLLKIDARRWIFWLAPHSPIISGDYFAVLQWILPTLKQHAIDAWVAFLRINGITEHTKQNAVNYKDIWCRPAPIHMHAEETNLLTLEWTEEDMLKQVKKNTRYMINRARREWVTVEHDNSPESITNFIDMHLWHAKRTNGKLQYNPFSASYIHELFTQFGERVNVFNAYFEGVKEAACITVQFGETTVYYLWASDVKHPKFSPAYLCQWTAIQYAREQGSTSYNFRGVSPDANPKHPLYGVSFFKRSFGGEDHFLGHAQDYIFTSKYWITRVIERYRAWKRWYYYPSPTT